MNRSTATILIILAIGIFFTFTSPQYKGAQGLAAEAREYREVVDNVSRIASTRDNLLASYESIPAAEKERLAKVLPDNIDAVGLARDLDTIASQYGIALRSLEIDEDTDPRTGMALPEYEAPYEKAIVSFSFVADYPNFVKFLADLEKSLRLMDVKSVVWAVGEQGSLYEHRVTVETYWLK